MRILKWIVGLLVGVSLAAAVTDTRAQSDWKGMDRMEVVDPRFERKTTLRIIESNGDLDDTLNNQGSILGYGAAAATGNLDSITPPGSTEGLEIMKKGELAADRD